MTIKDSKQDVIVVGIRFTPEEVSQIDTKAKADGRTRSGYLRKITLDTLGGIEA